MKIVCLGDSCTYGQNVRADQAWPAVLARLTGHDVRNEGVCGDTTRLGLERWKYAVGLHSPDVVVLQFGHNDANEWDGEVRVSAEAYRANLREMIQRSRTAIVLNPHKVSHPQTEAYAKRLWAYGIPGWPVLDIPILADGYGVHPDVDGHRIYAEHVASCL